MSANGGAIRLRLGSSAGFFDLHEVMQSVGEWPALRWVLRDAYFNGDVTSVWPEGWQYAEAASEKPDGLAVRWEQMTLLGQNCQQIVDGRFTGYDDDGWPAVQLLVVDSSSWIVWSRDSAVLDAVRSAFPHAEPHDERGDDPAPDLVKRRAGNGAPQQEGTTGVSVD